MKKLLFMVFLITGTFVKLESVTGLGNNYHCDNGKRCEGFNDEADCASECFRKGYEKSEQDNSGNC